mmetsp:Transcript_32862/g.67891  ORF Transcript_32862/g.67891 Transcript_32862/m.67891 type:complete len:149 (+) Transcript_32862:82-528(+)
MNSMSSGFTRGWMRRPAESVPRSGGNNPVMANSSALLLNFSFRASHCATASGLVALTLSLCCSISSSIFSSSLSTNAGFIEAPPLKRNVLDPIGPPEAGARKAKDFNESELTSRSPKTESGSNCLAYARHILQQRQEKGGTPANQARR